MWKAIGGIVASLWALTAFLGVVIVLWVPDGYSLFYAMIWLFSLSILVAIGGVAVWYWRWYLRRLAR